MEESDTLTSLTKRVKDLEKIVNCLCITNFMTEHQDGDEDARNDSVQIVNFKARQAKDRYKAYNEYGALAIEHRDIANRMMTIAEDYPELKEHIK